MKDVINFLQELNDSKDATKAIENLHSMDYEHLQSIVFFADELRKKTTVI